MSDIERFSTLPVLKYWTTVREPLFDLLKAIENKIDRERRDEVEARARGMRIWLLTNLRVSREMFTAIESMTGDGEGTPVRKETSVAVPPLARVILESLFSLTFVFDSPSNRLPWFWKNTWREIKRERDEYDEYTGDPDWDAWLAKLDSEAAEWQNLLAEHGTPLSLQQLGDYTTVEYWPTPGRMRAKCISQERKDLIAYFAARYYAPLSAAAHLSGTGLLAQGGIFLRDQPPDMLQKYFSDQVLKALTLLFALASQYILDVVPERALAEKMIALWETPNFPDAGLEVFKTHFETRLRAVQ
jgi:hypothetical protein